MAKKGQTVQLQTELNTDEEWEKYLQKPGLLVIDVYSDWCGPCAGMQANLKKIKVEIGGDTLQLAVAKCDGITSLERFRGTSEPTWMLVSGGKMVNFMYGANAPKLTQLITEELKIQKMVEDGTYTRENVLEVTDRAPDEAKRWEAIQTKIAEEEALEEKKRAEEVHQRLLKESDAILENLGNLGVMVVLPHARDKYQDVMKDLMNEAGLVISISEKVISKCSKFGYLNCRLGVSVAQASAFILVTILAINYFDESYFQRSDDEVKTQIKLLDDLSENRSIYF